MRSLHTIFLVLQIYLVFCQNSLIPNYVHKCTQSNVNSGCGVQSAQYAFGKLLNGDTNLGIPTLSPYSYGKLDIASTILHLNLKNVELYGLDTYHFNSVTWESPVLMVNVSFRQLYLLGQYENFKTSAGYSPQAGLANISISDVTFHIQALKKADMVSKNVTKFSVFKATPNLKSELGIIKFSPSGQMSPFFIIEENRNDRFLSEIFENALLNIYMMISKPFYTQFSQETFFEAYEFNSNSLNSEQSAKLIADRLALAGYTSANLDKSEIKQNHRQLIADRISNGHVIAPLTTKTTSEILKSNEPALISSIDLSDEEKRKISSKEKKQPYEDEEMIRKMVNDVMKTIGAIDAAMVSRNSYVEEKRPVVTYEYSSGSQNSHYSPHMFENRFSDRRTSDEPDFIPAKLVKSFSWTGPMQENGPYYY